MFGEQLRMVFVTLFLAPAGAGRGASDDALRQMEEIAEQNAAAAEAEARRIGSLPQPDSDADPSVVQGDEPASQAEAAETQEEGFSSSPTN